MSAVGDNIASAGPQCRVLIQQCMHAELRVDDTNFVKIGRGIVVFVSFWVGASEDVVRKAAQSILKLKLSENNDGKLVSVIDLPGSVLLVPQACLGGKRKNNSMQYHQLVGKDRGRDLFNILEAELRQIVGASSKVDAITDEDSRPAVRSGVYGARQVLTMDCSMGPFSHVIDF